MAAAQDLVKCIGDLQVVAVDVVGLVKGGNLFAGLFKLVSDAAPLAADVASFAPEAAELKQAALDDYNQVAQAALQLVFAVIAAAAV